MPYEPLTPQNGPGPSYSSAPPTTVDPLQQQSGAQAPSGGFTHTYTGGSGMPALSQEQAQSLFVELQRKGISQSAALRYLQDKGVYVQGYSMMNTENSEVKIKQGVLGRAASFVGGVGQGGAEFVHNLTTKPLGKLIQGATKEGSFGNRFGQNLQSSFADVAGDPGTGANAAGRAVGKAILGTGAAVAGGVGGRALAGKGAQVAGAAAGRAGAAGVVPAMTAAAGFAGESLGATAAYDFAVNQELPTVEEIRNGALIDLGVTALFRGLGSGYKFLNKGAFETADEVIEAASRQNIDLPTSALTNSSSAQFLEGIARKGFFGGPIEKTVQTAKSQVDEAAQAIIGKFDTGATNLDFGQSMKNSFDNFKQAFNESKTELYKGLDELVDSKNINVRPVSTIDTVQAIVGDRGSSLIPTQGSGLFTSLRDVLTGAKLKVGGSAVDSIMPATKDLSEVTLDALKQTRSAVGRLLKSSDPIATGNKADLKRLYAALSDDIDTAYAAASEEAASALKEANDFFRENIQLINSKLGKSIENLNPEKIAGQIVKPNNVSTVEAFKVFADDETLALAQSVFFRDIVEKSMKDGVLDPKKFVKNLGKWDYDTLSALLNDEQLKMLDDVTKNLDDLKIIGEAIKKGERPAVGSQTAFIQKFSQTFPIGAGGFLLGGPGGAATAISATLMGDYALARAFSSSRVKSFLLRGLDRASQEAVEEAIKRSKLIQQIVKGAAKGLSTEESGTSTEDDMVNFSTDESLQPAMPGIKTPQI